MNKYLTPVIRFCEGEKFELLLRALRSLICINNNIRNVVLIHTNGLEVISLESHLPRSLYNKIDYLSIESECDSRSKAIMEAKSKIKGEYVIFLDYDDEIDCRSSEIIDDFQMISNFKLIFGNYSYLYYEDKYDKQVLKDIVCVKLPNVCRKSYCLKNYSPMGSFIISKKLFDKVNVDETLIYQEDYYLLLSSLALITDDEVMLVDCQILRCWRDLGVTHAEKYKFDNLYSTSFINQKKLELLCEK